MFGIVYMYNIPNGVIVRYSDSDLLMLLMVYAEQLAHRHWHFRRGGVRCRMLLLRSLPPFASLFLLLRVRLRLLRWAHVEFLLCRLLRSGRLGGDIVWMGGHKKKHHSECIHSKTLENSHPNFERIAENRVRIAGGTESRWKWARILFVIWAELFAHCGFRIRICFRLSFTLRFACEMTKYYVEANSKSG